MNRFSALLIPFATIIFFFASLYFFSLLFGPLPFSVNSVQTTKSDLFTVTGEGEASAVPDTAQFSVGITETANTVEAAQNAANQTANAIIEGLKGLGIEENKIQTGNYSVNPNYDFSNGGNQRITGYTVTQNLNVEVTPVDRANQAIDIATKNGANTAGGVTFVLNDEKRMELENTARKQAIDEAKSKAKNIADIAGIRLGKLINVQESSFSPGPIPFEARSAVVNDVSEEAVQTQLEPGENAVNISVTLFYETL